MLALRSASLARGGVRGFSASALVEAHHKIVVVGQGSAGVAVTAQLKRAFAGEKRPLSQDDVAVIEPAKEHHYQPGWTLVGTGLAPLSDMHKPMDAVISSDVTRYNDSVATFSPDKSALQTAGGEEITYDYLVVAPGLKSNFAAIKGLDEALKAPESGVSSIYALSSVEKTWKDIQNFKGGKAIFTQPAGIIKCAGAPQKVLWMALSQWNKDGKRADTQPTFATGTPSMFGVPKYNAALEKLRVERNVDGKFNHNLIAVDHTKKEATFKTPNGDVVEKYDLLHVVPPQGPLDFVKDSPLADAAGWVSVDQATTQHTKFPNVFSLGDASSLPNSKTAAAVFAQAPVLVDNLRAHLDGAPLPAKYDGYASCPLLTGHNELMLAEFKYGGVPKETFAAIMGSQDIPRRAFFNLKKDFFPWVYWNAAVKGTWFGNKGPLRPLYYLRGN